MLMPLVQFKVSDTHGIYTHEYLQKEIYFLYSIDMWLKPDNLLTFVSFKAWPITGGKSLSEEPTSKDLLLTG